MAPMLNRRGAILGLAFAGAAAGWTVPVVAQPAAGAPLTWTPKAISPAQARTLSAACEAIVPATDTPGAIAVGVPQYIDRAMADWCEPADAERLRAGLSGLDEQAKAKYGAGFSGLTGEQQAALLSAVDTEAQAAARQRQPHYFTLLRDLTTAGYFTSEVGATKALRYDPIPGEYHGCVPLSKIGRAWATS